MFKCGRIRCEMEIPGGIIEKICQAYGIDVEVDEFRIHKIVSVRYHAVSIDSRIIALMRIVVAFVGIGDVATGCSSVPRT